MATKIKLMRLGKIRAPYYRVVVADSRTKRDGRSIETIGKYHPKEDPSFIEINSERVQYWLGVGAQPTEAVAAILRVTGDWQRFRGEPAPEPMLTRAAKVDKRTTFQAVALESVAAAEAERPAGRGGARRAADKAARPSDQPTADQMAAAAAEQGRTLTEARQEEAGSPVTDTAPAAADAAPVTPDTAPATPDNAPATPDTAPATADAAPATPDTAPATADAPPATADTPSPEAAE